jgi:rRNA maturation RNase YbeY
VLAALELVGVELSLALVDDDEMRVLNRRYRGYDRPTDVLSFGLAEDAVGPAPSEGAPRILGDVVISIDTAAAQARALGTTLGRRLETLLIHGVLHLLGYDHEVSPAEARRMARAARRVETALASVTTGRTRARRVPRTTAPRSRR